MDAFIWNGVSLAVGTGGVLDLVQRDTRERSRFILAKGVVGLCARGSSPVARRGYLQQCGVGKESKVREVRVPRSRDGAQTDMVSGHWIATKEQPFF